MKLVLCLMILICMGSCKEFKAKPNSVQPITDPTIQATVFSQLISLTNGTISGETANDSLAFLVLPLQASCPACRKKTIDSILKHQHNLRERHFILISASGGRKTMNSYFEEENNSLPEMENKLFLDSANLAYKYDLYKDNPVVYYTFNKKVYKKVATVPATVRDDLREFFSGTRTGQQTIKKAG
jgi:hypothetical protein